MRSLCVCDYVELDYPHAGTDGVEGAEGVENAVDATLLALSRTSEALGLSHVSDGPDSPVGQLLRSGLMLTHLTLKDMGDTQKTPAFWRLCVGGLRSLTSLRVASDDSRSVALALSALVNLTSFHFGEWKGTWDYWGTAGLLPAVASIGGRAAKESLLRSLVFECCAFDETSWGDPQSEDAQAIAALVSSAPDLATLELCGSNPGSPRPLLDAFGTSNLTRVAIEGWEIKGDDAARLLLALGNAPNLATLHFYLPHRPHLPESSPFFDVARAAAHCISTSRSIRTLKMNSRQFGHEPLMAALSSHCHAPLTSLLLSGLSPHMDWKALAQVPARPNPDR